jgi:hypothetical protein
MDVVFVSTFSLSRVYLTKQQRSICRSSSDIPVLERKFHDSYEVYVTTSLTKFYKNLAKCSCFETTCRASFPFDWLQNLLNWQQELCFFESPDVSCSSCCLYDSGLTFAWHVTEKVQRYIGKAVTGRILSVTTMLLQRDWHMFMAEQMTCSSMIVLFIVKEK